MYLDERVYVDEGQLILATAMSAIRVRSLARVTRAHLVPTAPLSLSLSLERCINTPRF